MSNPTKPITAQQAAKHSLLASTKRVSETLPTFTSWLLAGSGAAFTLVLANIDTVSKFIEITHIRFGLLMFLAGLGLSVLATYLSTVIKAAQDAHEDGEKLGERVIASSAFDLDVFIAEYERGLFPPIRWLVGKSLRKAKSGDVVAAARMVSKLSQIHALLVVVHSLLVLVAIGGLAFGLKMQ